MKKKVIGLFGLALGSVVLLSSCDFLNNTKPSTTNVVTPSTQTNNGGIVNDKVDDKKYQIYLLAQTSGFDGTYEEWLDSIKGDQVELRTSNGAIEWKYAKATSWTTLVSLKDLAGQNGKEVELSTNESYIVWRYKGDENWKNLIEISTVSAGKSAYEIAKEVGFTGSETEWVASLQGNGIEKIEKTKTEGLVDTYTITFTNGSTFEYTVTNGSGATIAPDEPIGEEYRGLGFNEIVGYGYSLTDVYTNSDTLIVPSTYKNKPVVGLSALSVNNSNIKNIVIPSSVINISSFAVSSSNLENIYYDGDIYSYLNIVNASSFLSSNIKLYLADDNGNITFNGKKYSRFYELTLDKDNINKIGIISNLVTTVKIPANFDTNINIDLSGFYDLDDIYFDGTIDEWFGLNIGYLPQFSELYVKNSANEYYLVQNIEVPSNFDGYLDDYLSTNMDIKSILIPSFELLEKQSNYMFVYKNNFEIFCNSSINDINKNIANLIADRLYVLDNGAYVLYSDITNVEFKGCVWEPVSFNDAKAYYKISGSLDTWMIYNRSYGPFSNMTYTNPIDGRTYEPGDLLPTWKEMSNMLNVGFNQSIEYGYSDAQSYSTFRSLYDNSTAAYKDKNNQNVDLFYNTVANLQELGNSGDLIDLSLYLNDNKMPALKKFLDNNSALYRDLTVNGHIYYAPYLDGYQDIERGFVIDTEAVEKLLDNELPTGTGKLVSGAANSTNPTIIGKSKITPFINADYNYPSDMKISIVNPKTNKAEKVTVKKTDNIIKYQNQLLNTFDGSCTGASLIDQFKLYARAAYGDIIDTYYDGKISKMFTSVGACYNTDDLIALFRIFKANPDVLYGSSSKYDEVVPIFVRGQAENRICNILNVGATLYGVQGLDSENEKLFFGADGKVHDFETQQSSYDMLDNLNTLYEEGLIQLDFWAYESKADTTYGYKKYFAKTAIDSTFGLLEYDYFTTQTAANDYINGVGIKQSERKSSASGYIFSETSIKGIMPILSPLTYVPTSSYSYDQALSDFTGKTLKRYYESNRTLKSTSIAIPRSSDNIDSAIAFIDFLYTKEGNELFNYGPSEYWQYGTALDGQSPVFKQNFINAVANSNISISDYLNRYLGSLFSITYRPNEFYYQTANDYAKIGYENVYIAIREGVQLISNHTVINDVNWNSSMYTNFTGLREEPEWSGILRFWAYSGKLSSSNNVQNGWVYVVVNGTEKANKNVVITDLNSDGLTYENIKNQRTNKNKSYLYAIGKYLDLIPAEAYL